MKILAPLLRRDVDFKGRDDIRQEPYSKDKQVDTNPTYLINDSDFLVHGLGQDQYDRVL